MVEPVCAIGALAYVLACVGGLDNYSLAIGSTGLSCPSGTKAAYVATCGPKITTTVTCIYDDGDDSNIKQWVPKDGKCRIEDAPK